MIILIVESAPPSLRGELSKWMLEPKAGVYVGTISGAVRDLLWEKACQQVGYGGCTMIHSAKNEQGFAIRSFGDTSRVIEDWEGLFLVRRVADAAEPELALSLWGKMDPFQPLPCHMIDAGHVAQALLDTATYAGVRRRLETATGCPSGILRNWLGYIVALHDWGKGWRNFQARGPSHLTAPLLKEGLSLTQDEIEKTVRHEVISRVWVEEHLKDWGGWNRRSLRTVGIAVEAHHGRMHQRGPVLFQFPGYDQWDALRKEAEEMVRGAFELQPWEADFADHSVAGILLSGLIVFADWIASNEELFALRWKGEPWSDYIGRSRTEANRAVGLLGFGTDNPWAESCLFIEQWPTFANPRPIQVACSELAQSEAIPGLVIVEAPMGEGKSEAALYLGSQWLQSGGGMFMALPTAATSNQMFNRVRAFTGEHHPEAEAGVQLVHGTSWLVDRGTPLNPPEVFDEEEDPYGYLALDWFRPRKRSLLATYGVGTIDQALMAVMHVKHSFLRLFGLAGKVLVIDEVHAYDAYMNEILTLLLSWCRALGTPVILLSATLPNARRAELVNAYLGENRLAGDDAKSLSPYPMLTYASPGGEIREIAVSPGDRKYEIQVRKHFGALGDPEQVVDLVLERLGHEGCLCVIANTVDSAQAIYAELGRRDPDLPKLLFHARFPVGKRQKIEEQALAWFDKRSLLPESDPGRTERPQRAVLIATQVVEQSLDLDFDEMISEIAPIDLLLQRCGRLHRHVRRERIREPLFHVLLPEEGQFDFGGSGRVYAPYVLIRTSLAIEEQWLLPEDIRPLIEGVYGAEPSDLQENVRQELVDTYSLWVDKQENEARQADKYLMPGPYPKAFRLERVARNLFEEDDGVQTYLTAKTRLGDRTMKVLLMEGEQWDSVLESSKVPSRSLLEAMLMQTVNLPRWWLKDIEPEDGYESLTQAPRWLPAETVLCMVKGSWFGRDKAGKVIKVQNHGELGVRRQEMEGGRDDQF